MQTEIKIIEDNCGIILESDENTVGKWTTYSFVFSATLEQVRDIEKQLGYCGQVQYAGENRWILRIDKENGIG